jgi:eukaryotic-like serine/threonine-protein kinase
MTAAPPDDEIERKWIVAEAQARLFDEPRAPVRIARFELRDRLGRGGVGVVYSAFDPELDREVAIKLLRADRSAGDDRERLMREARAMARLTHPNVVPVYEVGEDQGRVFLAMERVAGHTARAWIAATGPTWREIVRIYVQAGRGLAAAHGAKLVHRDFKPDNVLVGADGRARVTDFGIADTVDAIHYGGTPAYMAPEQRALQPIGAAADQYAFAVSLFEALYGKRPEMPLVAPQRTSVPRRIFTALERALSADPAARWTSLTALLDTIEHPPRRRALRIIGWTLLALVLTAALIGALLQMWMFRDWMSAARS